MTIVKATPTDVGCYVEGSWGQFAGAHMIQRAAEFGYDDLEALSLATRHLSGMGPDAYAGLDDTEHESLQLAVDDAEGWLNEHVAPEDYSFGWHDGEFFLQSVDWWNEDAGI